MMSEPRSIIQDLGEASTRSIAYIHSYSLILKASGFRVHTCSCECFVSGPQEQGFGIISSPSVISSFLPYICSYKYKLQSEKMTARYTYRYSAGLCFHFRSNLHTQHPPTGTNIPLPLCMYRQKDRGEKRQRCEDAHMVDDPTSITASSPPNVTIASETVQTNEKSSLALC